MLTFLLDEHISRQVAAGLRRRNRLIPVHSLPEWNDGSFLSQDDALILREAGKLRLTLVTYDRRTIPPLLKAWMEEGRNHGGVIFVDERTIPPSDFGALIRALDQLWTEYAHSEWTNRVVFLRR